MSFKDCILSNVQKGMLDQSDAEKLVKDYDDLIKKNTEVAAVDKLEARLIEEKIRKQANVLRHMKKREVFFNEMNARKTVSERASYVSEKLQSARDRGEGSYKNMLAVFNQSTKDISLDSIDEATFKDAATHVIDGTSSKDPNTQAIIDGLKSVFKYAKNEADTFGVHFGDLGERYFPRFYDKAQFRAMGDDAFIEAARPHLKFDNATDVEIREALISFKRDVETDGLYSATNLETLDEAASGVSTRKPSDNFQNKRNKSRELNFKSGKDYIDFTKKMGGTEITFVEHFNKYMFGLSSDLGVAKTLGPMPRAMVDEAELRLKADLSIKSTKKGNLASVGVRSVRGEFEVLMGTSFTGDADHTALKMFRASQNWMRACHLGSATISAISDTAVNGMTMKMNGGSFLKPLADYAATIQGVYGGTTSAKKITKELGYLVEGFNGMMIGDTRFALGEAGRGISGKISTMVFKASGLDAWTKNGRAIAQTNAVELIAEKVQSGVSWTKLPDYLKQNLERNGMTEGEWGEVLTHLKAQAMNGRDIIQTNDLRVNKDVGFAKGSDLADKLDATVIRLKNLAINENNLKTDAWTSGANFAGEGKVGGVGKAGAGALFQYKSYAITVLNNHLIPALSRASQAIGERNIRKLDHLAMLMIGTTLFAAVPLQLKEIIKGRKPKDMNDPDFWIASILQGGGMGIYGDFLFKDFSRSGNDFVANLAGPYASSVQDVVKVVSGAAWGEIDGDEDAKKLMSARERRQKEAWRVLKRNIPANNLWYTRLLTERLLFDNIERLVDPKFDKRMKKMERKLTKERDGDAPYWWGPGQTPEPEKIIARKTARR